MGDFQNQQVGAEQDDLQNRDAQAIAEEHPATAQVRSMLAARDPQAIGEVIRSHPEAKAEIYALLHKTLGNQFVTQVQQFADQGGARGKGGKFTSDELRNIVDGDGSALDKKPAGNPNKFSPDELRNIVDGDGSALDKKTAQAPGNPNKFSPDELRNIIDGDGSALDKKAAVTKNDTVVASSSEVKQPEIVKTTEVLKDPTQKADEPQKAAPDKDDSGENEASGGAKPDVGPVKVTASVLRVRSSPTIARDNIVGRLMRNQVVEAVGHQGEWVEINYRGQTAFIHQSFVVSAQEAPAAKTQDAPTAATAP